jgi:hypothetical protein
MPDPDPIEDLKQKEARLKAETALLRAEADVTKAQAELIAAGKAPDAAIVATAAEKARLEAQKAALDAAKALSDAKKGADLAAAQASIGTVTGSNIEGTVTVKGDAGKGEATLLAARAITRAADKLVEAITNAVDGKRVVLMQGVESPQFGNYRQFLLQQAAVERMFKNADIEADRLSKQGKELESVRILESMAILTTAGVAIDAAAKLGSYFMSNYEVGSLSLTPDTEQLVSAVANRLLGKARSVALPARRVPQSSEFSTTIEKLAQLTTDAETKAVRLSVDAQRARSASTGDKEQLQKAAAAYEQGTVLLRKVISKAEEFVAGLAVADTKGVLLITKIAQEKAVCDELNSEALALFLDVRAMIGGYYTEKNLWTFFGGMPFHAMGGVVVTYYLVDKNGDVHGSGLIPVHSGYAAVSKVPDLVN